MSSIVARNVSITHGAAQTVMNGSRKLLPGELAVWENTIASVLDPKHKFAILSRTNADGEFFRVGVPVEHVRKIEI